MHSVRLRHDTAPIRTVPCAYLRNLLCNCTRVAPPILCGMVWRYIGMVDG